MNVRIPGIASTCQLDIAQPHSIIVRTVSTDPRPAHLSRRRTGLAILIFALMFALAVVLDVPLSTWARDSGAAAWLKNHTRAAHLIRFPGNFYFTIVICGAILAMQWRAGAHNGWKLWSKPAIVFLAGILSGINALLKFMVGRIRPFHGVPPFQLHPFSKSLGDAEAGFSFPSGDASLAFAMAMSLSFILPRLWPLWWALALIVGLERIAENAHYPSDVVAGAALGVACALIAGKFIRTLVKRNANPTPEAAIPS